MSYTRDFFHTELWDINATPTPEQNLWIAVIERAVRDYYIEQRGSTKRSQSQQWPTRREKESAKQYIFRGDMAADIKAAGISETIVKTICKKIKEHDAQSRIS